MRIDVTKEAVASESLYDYFSGRPASVCTVHSWHPPDSKAYFTHLLYIPQNGRRSHVDLIVQIGLVLYLIEVKDCLAHSYQDVEKLRGIVRDFPTEALVRRFRQQGLTFSRIPRETRIAVAALEEDQTFLNMHPDIPALLADEKGVRSANEAGKQLLL